MTIFSRNRSRVAGWIATKNSLVRITLISLTVIVGFFVIIASLMLVGALSSGLAGKRENDMIESDLRAILNTYVTVSSRKGYESGISMGDLAPYLHGDELNYELANYYVASPEDPFEALIATRGKVASLRGPKGITLHGRLKR